MNEKTFKITYENWEQFQNVRKKYQSQDIFKSYQYIFDKTIVYSST